MDVWPGLDRREAPVDSGVSLLMSLQPRPLTYHEIPETALIRKCESMPKVWYARREQ